MPDFNQLLDQYLRNELDGDELKSFLEAVRKPENAETLRTAVMQKLKDNAHSGFSDPEEIDTMFEQMLQKANPPQSIPEVAPVVLMRAHTRWRVFKIAAACLLLISAGAYLWFNNSAKPPHIARQQPVPQQDVAPGGNKAILTLSDGTTIDLNDAANGTLAQQGNASLVKNADGELVYEANKKKTSELYYNTMATPRGGQYKLVLPDGTRVWLNASSSIRYPAVFNDSERRVTMEGEAYFEVAHKNNHPFFVNANGTEIQVTGTHFNVNAYSDEAVVRTTLLEGGVTVKNGGLLAKLKPGEQVEAGNKGLSAVQQADTEDAVAWKNGLFSFNGDDLTSIMRQLARWYDLEVHYEGQVPRRLFAGKVFRNMQLSETLRVLELSNIHFRIEGRKLTVIP
ncbi:MAG: FecR family protein [Agriterribacter sp.]